MTRLDIPTERGSVLTGVLFPAERADTAVIAITGIHGNFYSNPFYYNIGATLNSGGVDFIYAQTNDAFSEIETYNVKTGEAETIGSWNERFSYTDDDVSAYLNYAAKNYKHVILAGHSLGANKVIHYLSTHHDKNLPEHFMLLSPANLTYMMKEVTDREKEVIERFVRYGKGGNVLPFYFMGWVICTADTANDWLHGELNNVHVGDGDFSQVEQITHTGALVIGTYDNFTCGTPSEFLKNINAHMPTAAENKSNCHIYLRGENIPAAFIEVSVFGNEDHAGYDKLTAEITKIFSSTLGISTKNIYVKFDDIANWGVAGMNIDRTDYL